MACLDHAAEAFALQVRAEAGFVSLVEHSANAQDAELVRRPGQTALPCRQIDDGTDGESLEYLDAEFSGREWQNTGLIGAGVFGSTLTSTSPS